MYASCPAYYDEIGRGNLTPEQERELYDKLPAFDPITARSQRENGALVEFFRTYPGTVVNAHVARFALWGRNAHSLASPQPWDFAFGRGSALDRLVELRGKILLLGSDPDNTTFLHHAEHVAEFPGKRIARFKVPITLNGTRVWRAMAEVDTSGAGAHAHWPDRFFARIIDTFLADTGNLGGDVGAARSFLIDAAALLVFSARVMTAVAADAAAAARLLLPDRPSAPAR
jgi:aminoglycoside 3-N-acetyltransferase